MKLVSSMDGRAIFERRENSSRKTKLQSYDDDDDDDDEVIRRNWIYDLYESGLSGRSLTMTKTEANEG